MLSINDLKPDTVFLYKGEPFEVIEAKHLHLGRGGAILQTKIKNLKTGNIIKQNFKPSDSFEEVDVSRETVKYLYNHRGKYFFCFLQAPSKRFFLEEKIIQEKKDFLKPGLEVQTIEIKGEILDIILPIKITLKVVDTPPAFKGNTAQATTKPAILETGAQIKVPFFIENGDIIIVNTRKREYVERAK
jgi:elongation factor P